MSTDLQDPAAEPDIPRALLQKQCGLVMALQDRIAGEVETGNADDLRDLAEALTNVISGVSMGGLAEAMPCLCPSPHELVHHINARVDKRIEEAEPG